MVSLSVLVPNYNYGRFLGECLESASRASTGIDAEIVVSDNASTDESIAVINGAISRDIRIRLIQQSMNVPFQENWNACLREARGRYLHFLCADDVLCEDTLVKKMAFLKHDSRCVIANQDFIEATSVLKFMRRVNCLSGSHNQITIRGLTEKSGCNLLGGPSNFLFQNTGKIYFEKKYKWLADFDFYYKLLEFGDYAHIGGVGYIYRRHEATLSNEIGNADREREWSKWQEGARPTDGMSDVSFQGYMSWMRMRIMNKIEEIRSLRR